MHTLNVSFNLAALVVLCIITPVKQAECSLATSHSVQNYPVTLSSSVSLAHRQQDIQVVRDIRSIRQPFPTSCFV